MIPRFRPRILSSQILNNPFHRSKNRNPCNLILVSSSAMRGSERWPTLGRGCCWNPFTDVEDGLRGLEGPRPCSRRLKVGTRGRLQRKYQMLSAGSRSIRVPLVHSRKFPRLGRTIMKSVRAICTRSSSSRDSSSSRVTILRAFEIVNTI